MVLKELYRVDEEAQKNFLKEVGAGDRINFPAAKSSFNRDRRFRWLC